MGSISDKDSGGDIKPFRFFDLPYDIRYQIYRTMTVPPDGPRSSWQYEHGEDDGWPPIEELEKASRQLASELKAITKRCLQIERESVMDGPFDVEYWLDKVGRHKLKHMRMVRFDYSFDDWSSGFDWYPESPGKVFYRLWYDYLNPQDITINLSDNHHCHRSPGDSWCPCLGSPGDAWCPFIPDHKEFQELLDILEGYSTATTINFIFSPEIPHFEYGGDIEKMVREFAKFQGFSVALEDAVDPDLDRWGKFKQWKLLNDKGEEDWARVQAESEEYWEYWESRGEEARLKAQAAN